VVSESTTDPSPQRYGPITFVAALGNSLLVGLATWYFLPWFALALFVLPILLVDLALGAFLATRSGAMGQLGRGMLVGLITAPVTLLIFLPGLLLVQELGLV
jgi:hypothetical protein